MNESVIEKHCFVPIVIPHLVLIFVRAQKSAMQLPFLSRNKRLKVKALFLVDVVDAKRIEDLVHLVHQVSIRHHVASVEPNEIVFPDIIG